MKTFFKSLVRLINNSVNPEDAVAIVGYETQAKQYMTAEAIRHSLPRSNLVISSADDLQDYYVEGSVVSFQTALAGRLGALPHDERVRFMASLAMAIDVACGVSRPSWVESGVPDNRGAH